MEQLIIFAIIAIVSSLFGKSKNNKQQQQKQMPPFNKDEQPQSPVIMETEEVKPQRPTRPTIKTQSFEDFAREFLGDRKAEKPRVEARVKPVEEKVTEQIPSYMAPPLIPTEPSSRTTNRPSLGRLAAGKKEVNVATTNKGFQLPNSKKALMQAVVMAEVLGSPKAKRK
ncbi:hypothetical protein ACQKII_05225 [Lysinibacillus sp. NPDC048646]|uniref:hypothetical protein n=1 Tax=Lysinibacillus sp. NPDC048646 TaxID=3390574 RepID=UPI003D0661D1